MEMRPRLFIPIKKKEHLEIIAHVEVIAEYKQISPSKMSGPSPRKAQESASDELLY